MKLPVGPLASHWVANPSQPSWCILRHSESTDEPEGRFGLGFYFSRQARDTDEQETATSRSGGRNRAWRASCTQTR